MSKQKVTATTMNILYNTSSSGVDIETTYDPSTLKSEISGDNIISSSLITSSKLNLEFNENNTRDRRTCYFSVKKGDRTVGLLTVNQSGKEDKYFRWSDGSTAITIEHDYTSGQSYTVFETNYLENEFGFLPTITSIMKIPAILYHNNNFHFKFDENAGTTDRQETINIVKTSDSGVLATLTFIQTHKEQPTPTRDITFKTIGNDSIVCTWIGQHSEVITTGTFSLCLKSREITYATLDNIIDSITFPYSKEEQQTVTTSVYGKSKNVTIPTSDTYLFTIKTSKQISEGYLDITISVGGEEKSCRISRGNTESNEIEVYAPYDIQTIEISIIGIEGGIM